MPAPSPLVDVITATNRSGEYLETTVASVIRQTHTNWRLYIVDNGSPRPQALAAAVEAATRASATSVRSRISIEQIDGRGTSVARNHGIGQGRGKYIAVLDDDDVWDPQYLERMVSTLENNPDATAAYCAGRYLTPDGVAFGLWTARPATSRDLLRGDEPFPPINAIVFRRAIGDSKGWFNERYAYAEDNDLVCRFLIAGECIAVPEHLAFYRIHPGGVTQESHAIRLAWMAFEDWLARDIAEAKTQNDKDMARSLTRNRRLARLNAAEMASHSVLVALESRTNLHEARLTTRWAMTRAPCAFVRYGIRRITLRITRPLRRWAPRDIRQADSAG